MFGTFDCSISEGGSNCALCVIDPASCPSLEPKRQQGCLKSFLQFTWASSLVRICDCHTLDGAASNKLCWSFPPGVSPD